MERVTKKRPDSIPKRYNLGCGTHIPHGFAAFGAQRSALSGIRIWHAAGAVVNLAFAAVPFGRVAWVVVTIVFHGRGLS